MSSPTAEPGGWELKRALDGIQGSLTRIEERMVPRPEFNQYRDEVDRRFKASDDRLSTIQGEKSQAHGKIEAEVAELRQQLEADRRDRHTWTREVNARAWLAVAGSALAVVAGVVLAVVPL